MLTDEDYKALKPLGASLNAEGKAAVREYEANNPQHGAVAGELGAGGATGGEKLAERDEPLDVPALPADKPTALGVPTNTPAGQHALHAAEEYGPPELPSASRLKAIYKPPEYVAKNPSVGLNHILKAATLDSSDLTSPLSANLFYEPTEREFAKDQGDVMRARGIDPMSAAAAPYLAEYRDKKWHQAYQQAEAEDRPLTRIKYAKDSFGWKKLGDWAGQASDAARSFGRGLLLNTPDIAAGAVDYATRGGAHPTNYVGQAQDLEENHPIANVAGNVAGAAMPEGLLGKIGAGTGRAILRGLPGLAERLGGEGVAHFAGPAADALEDAPGATRKLAAAVGAGAVGAGTDTALRSAEAGAEAAPDQGASGGAKTAYEEFRANLPTSLALGGILGGAGHMVAEGANAVQRSSLRKYPQLSPLREGGGNTSVTRGVVPGPDAAANLELARPAAIGEAKTVLPGEPNATTIAAQKLQEPLTAENATSMKEARQVIEADKRAAYERDPKLREPTEYRATGNAALDWWRKELADATKYPGGKVNPEDLVPGGDVAEVRKLIQQTVKPKLVNTADASGMAARLQGPVVTLDEARQLGLDVRGLQNDLNAEGVPHNAPPIPDAAPGPAIDPLHPLGPPGGGPEPFIGPRRARGLPVGNPAAPLPFDKLAAKDRFDFARNDLAVSDPFAANRPPDRPPEVRDAIKSVVDNHIIPVPPRTRTPNAELPPELQAAQSRGTPSPPLVPDQNEPGKLMHDEDYSPPPPPAAAAPPSGPNLGGIPESQFRVVLMPKRADALAFEEAVSNVDRKANAGSAREPANPNWKTIQRAIRQDREQFGKPWTDMIADHHKVLNNLETRASDAGIRQNVPYSEMQPDQKTGFNANLEKHPATSYSKVALTSLASSADQRAARVAAAAGGAAPPPGVLHDLQNLGGQNAYTELHGLAVPKIGETASVGGVAGHIRGLGPAFRLRADAAAQAVSAGPTGEPTMTPRLLSYVQQNAPKSRYLPGMAAMGGGALGIKAATGYNALTPAQKEWLAKVVDAATADKATADKQEQTQ